MAEDYTITIMGISHSSRWEGVSYFPTPEPATLHHMYSLDLKIQIGDKTEFEGLDISYEQAVALGAIIRRAQKETGQW